MEKKLSRNAVLHQFEKDRFFTVPLPNGRYLAFRGNGTFVEGVGDTRLRAIEDLLVAEEEA
jgi:hypothetical protein